MSAHIHGAEKIGPSRYSDFFNRIGHEPTKARQQTASLLDDHVSPNPQQPFIDAVNAGRSILPHYDMGADGHPIKQVSHVVVHQAKAPGGNGLSNRLRRIGTVDAVDGVTKIHGAGAKGLPGLPAMKRGR